MSLGVMLLGVWSRVKTTALIAFMSLVGLALASCGSVKVEEYSDVKPAFKVTEFFDGQLKAYGIVKDRSGKMIRHFVADIEASWSNGVGTLDESFVFNDGEQQSRIWTLTPVSTPVSGSDEASSEETSAQINAAYIGTASDVIGEAKLSSAGNALFLNYVLRIPYKGDTIDIKVDDRMYLVDENVLINESAMYKFGFNVGEIVLTIQKIQ